MNLKIFYSQYLDRISSSTEFRNLDNKADEVFSSLEKHLNSLAHMKKFGSKSEFREVILHRQRLER